MNLFKKAILSLGGSLFKENILPELADSYTSGFQETVKGIPIVGGFLDTRLTKFLTSSMLPSTTVPKKPLEMADLPSGDSVGGGFGVRSKRYGAAQFPIGNNQFVNKLGILGFACVLSGLKPGAVGALVTLEIPLEVKNITRNVDEALAILGCG